MKCRGHAKREQIVQQYDVVPVAHFKLLNGETRHSDAEATIENEYYIFKVVDRANGNIIDTIQCGMGAAEDFFSMIDHDKLPIFNPLVGDIDGGHDRGPYGGDGGRRAVVWNPLAKQLYNAIMWIILLINPRPNSTIFDLKEKVYQIRALEPFASKIKAVNTVIRKNLKGQTLTEAINQKRLDNNLRDDVCHFDLIQEKMENMTDSIGNRIHIKSYF